MDTSQDQSVHTQKSNNYPLLILKIFLLILVILYIIFYKNLDFQKVFDLLKNVSLSNIFILPVIFLIAEYIQAPVIPILMKPYNIFYKSLNVMKINLMSAFYSLFPLGILGGGIVRWYRLSKQNKKRNEVFTVIILQKILSIISLLILALIILILHNPFGGETKHFFLLMSITFVVLILLGISLSVLISTKVMTFMDIKIISPIINKLPGFIREKIKNLWIAISGYKGQYKIILTALIITIGYKLGIFVFYFFSAKALNIPMTVESSLGLFFIVFGLMEVIPFFSALGFREGMFIELYPKYGISPEQAVSHSLFMFAFYTFFGGLLEFSYHFLRKKNE